MNKTRIKKNNIVAQNQKEIKPYFDIYNKVIWGKWSLNRMALDQTTRSKVFVKFGTRSNVVFGTRSKV